MLWYMTEMPTLVSYEIGNALKRVGLTCKACSKGYHIFSERLLCPGLTVTSLDVKETGEIFIDTISLEQCSTEQRSVIVDVMYLSFYLLWQSPQVCWVMLSTGA